MNTYLYLLSQALDHSILLKRMKVPAKQFADLIETLVQSGDIEVVTTPRAGTPQRAYRLLEGVKGDPEGER